jgi:signal transduction histidine kinase/ActR/RegA family two-component response regulator
MALVPAPGSGRSNSLFATIVLAAVVGLLVPAVVIGGWVVGVREPQVAHEALERQLEERLDGLANSLGVLLWNVDKPAASELLASAMRSPVVVRVSVAEGRNGANTPWLDERRPQRVGGRLLRGERAVVYGGEQVGKLVVELDDSEAVAATARARRLYLATVGGQLSISLALVVWLLNSRVLSPLRRLGRFAGALAGGRFDAALPATRSDEIGQLGQAMDRMRAALQQQFDTQASLMQELERHRSTLEERVRQRTAELERASEAAQAASRAKSAFVANMSHEMRTPLNAIIGLSWQAQRETRDPEQAARLAKVGSAAEHLLAVTNQVLDLSKIEAGKLRLETAAFELDTLLATVVGMTAPRAAERGLGFALEQPGHLRGLRLVGDGQRIAEVLLNFAGNAVKFTERGRVDLRVEERSREGVLLRLRFSVHDSGIGIAPEVLPRLFQEFEQADSSTTRRFGGTGLGLAISRRLAELMGGEVGASSVPGQGSEFWLEVPLRVSDPEPGERAPPHPGPVAGLAGRRVLVVEDNPVNQEVALAMLQSAGLRVEVAGDGQQALDRLADDDAFDAVLMDVQMPVLDGLAAARRLRGRGWRRPILAMTANAFAEDRERCIAAGMDDHVPKPVMAGDLFDTLSRWIGRESTAVPTEELQ